MISELLFSTLLFLGAPSGGQAPGIPEGCTDAPQAVAQHTGRFHGVRYDYPQPGQSTWYYSFTSGRRPAISHITFALPCPDLRILNAGMWDPEDPDLLLPRAGMPEPGQFPAAATRDPTTNVTGMKFDLGFAELATHHYFFTLNGNYEAAPMAVAFKAGPGFDLGMLCGPAADCDQSEQDAELSAIGSRVWLDENANGIRESGEAGVPGIPVRLLTPDGDLVAATQTDAEGRYLFDRLVAGDYRVLFLIPPGSGWLFTDPGVGSDPATDSDADPFTGKTGIIQLPPGSEWLTVDAGLIAAQASLSLTKTGGYHHGRLDAWNPCTVFGSAAAFNAIIFGDFTPGGGDTDGRLAVMGNLNAPAAYSVGHVIAGHPIPLQIGAGTDMLIVGGDFIDGTWGVNGNIVFAGERTGPVRWMPNGNLLRRVRPIRFDEQGNVPSSGQGHGFEELRGRLQAKSTDLGLLPERGVLSLTLGENHEYHLHGNDPALNVFHFPESEVHGRSFHIQAPEGSVVLINLPGQEIRFTGGAMRFTGVDHERVLWNFPAATGLTLNQVAVMGSVLAPFAAGDFSGGSINGRAVLGGPVISTQGFEFHNFHFLGQVCTQGSSPVPPPRVSYTFEVTNTGNVPLHGIWIDDPLAPASGGPISLAPGETDALSFTAEWHVTPDAFALGEVLNTATVHGFTPDGRPVSASGSHKLALPPPGGPAPVPPDETQFDASLVPDFVMRPAFAFSSKPQEGGQSFQLSLTIANEGSRPADAGLIRIWPALPQLLPLPSDSFVDVPAGYLLPGESRSVQIPGLTAAAEPGTFHVRAEILPPSDTAETVFGNNFHSDAYTIFDPEADWMKPDFVVTAVELLPAPGHLRARFEAIVHVKNEGPRTGDAGTLGFWPASPEYLAELENPPLTAEVGILSPGETRQLRFSGLRAPGTAGTFHAMAIVNIDRRTAELADGNNHSGATYTLFPVELDFAPAPEGTRIAWNSTPGFLYVVERADNLNGPFTDIAANLPATPPLNQFIDPDPPESGMVFYRVWGYLP